VLKGVFVEVYVVVIVVGVGEKLIFGSKHIGSRDIQLGQKKSFWLMYLRTKPTSATPSSKSARAPAATKRGFLPPNCFASMNAIQPLRAGGSK
jgi:hypothetical protein